MQQSATCCSEPGALDAFRSEGRESGVLSRVNDVPDVLTSHPGTSGLLKQARRCRNLSRSHCHSPCEERATSATASAGSGEERGLLS
jgi:hypothetical protein